MRIKLTLHNPKPHALLGWNYNYLVMSWIYRTLEAADPDYSQFLHQEGYRSEENQKQFKYFTFSPFYFRKAPHQFVMDKPRGLVLKTDTLFIDLSFYVPQAAENFIIGVFQHQRMHLFNRRFDVDFEIVQVEVLPEPDFQEQMRYEAIAPLLVESKRADKKYGDYLSPTHPDFGKLLAINLADKYANATGQAVSHEDIQFKLLSDPTKIKSRKETIKEGSGSSTDVVGYTNFTFQLTAPPALHACGYASGMARYNAEGFGMVGVGE